MATTPQEKAINADGIIKNHVVYSMGAGLIPIPVADILAVTAIQLDMVRQLCRNYELDFSETQGKAIVSALTGSTLARIGAGIVKIIPGVGSILGGVTMSVLSGASTYAIGEVFKMHFETGGTILDFDAERFKKYYNEKFEKGKKVAQDFKKEQDTSKKTGGFTTNSSNGTPKTAEKVTDNSNSNQTIAKLKELGDLKSAGIISDAEFDKMKAKILEGL